MTEQSMGQEDQTLTRDAISPGNLYKAQDARLQVRSLLGQLIPAYQ